MQKQNKYIKMAIEESKKCLKNNDVPVGCVIVRGGEIIAKAYNKRELRSDVFAHAEILAIKKAVKVIGSHNLSGCEMYVSLQPCIMCAGAIFATKIANIYFAAYNIKSGYKHFSKDEGECKESNHYVKFKGGIHEKEASVIISTFFKNIRKSV